MGLTAATFGAIGCPLTGLQKTVIILPAKHVKIIVIIETSRNIHPRRAGHAIVAGGAIHFSPLPVNIFDLFNNEVV